MHTLSHLLTYPNHTHFGQPIRQEPLHPCLMSFMVTPKMWYEYAGRINKN